MSSKILLSFLGGCLLVFGLLNVNVLQVQAVDSSALTGSQLSGVYDLRNGRGTRIQVTNTSKTTPVTLHFQLLSQPGCLDHDFVDTLTPADTVIYDLGSLERNPVNIAGLPIPEEAPGNEAATPNINVDDTMGLIVITATTGPGVEAPAIAHNHLHGVVNFYNTIPGVLVNGIETLYTYNMVARSAVTAGGAALADGTVLDGTTGLLEQIIPSLMHIHYTDAFDQNNLPVVFADLMMAAFRDDHTGGIYLAHGATSDTYTKTVYDQDEQESSCAQISFTCNEKIGINNEHPSSRTVLSDENASCDFENSSTGGECFIASCKASITDDLPGPHPSLVDEDCNVLCADSEVDFDEGYTRLRSIGGGDADVVYGILGLSTSDQGGAYRIHFE